ncbi:MAG: hypothetical protein L3K17_08105 [Thermoplasmata archaeon]|nr:hypothetical protein [Thermoplasmata archaeon]
MTYKMNPPGEFGETLFVMKKEFSRYAAQTPHEWFVQNKADWADKQVVSIEAVD